MSSEETDAEDSRNSMNDVSSLDDVFLQMQFESSSSEEETTDDNRDLQVSNEIESESDAEFQANHQIVEEVMPTSEENTIDPLIVIDISSPTK